MTLKIATIFCNYGPYHLARIEEFFQLCQTRGWELIGIELARAELKYPWQTQTENSSCKIVSVIDNQPLESTSIWKLFPKLISILNKYNPDVVVISGYALPAMLVALFWSHLFGKSAILFSETTEDDAPRSRLREILKSWLVNKYKAALVGGRPHKRYMIKLGMPEGAIFLGYDVVGNDAFHPNRIKSLKSPLEKPFFLAINRFIPKKNLSFLIFAYAAYRQQVGDDAWDLVLCGDGKLRPQIEQQITELGLQKYIHLPGFLQQNEMLPYFGNAKCFIHSSTHEQWGLVVNEAMAAGLPVLVSNRCGCFEDLVIDGVNGFGFDPENSQQLTELMLKISSDKFDRTQMGQAALQHIQKYSPAYFASGLAQAVEYTLPILSSSLSEQT